VRQALAGNDVRRLLILATSDNMIEKIVKRLELPEPEKTVYIQQIVSKQEIKKAKQARLRDGKHIVPVPTVELKPHFTGYFADLPYNLFSKQRKKSGEDRSIVRPDKLRTETLIVLTCIAVIYSTFSFILCWNNFVTSKIYFYVKRTK